MITSKSLWNILFAFFCLASPGYAQEIDYSRYYPMHINDIWTYAIFGNKIALTVKITGDTIMLNGRKYFIFKRIYQGDYRRFDTLTYERIDSNNCLWKYRLKDSTDVLLIDFKKEVNSTFNSYLLNDYGSTAIIDYKGKIKVSWWTGSIEAIVVIIKRPYDEDVEMFYSIDLGMMKDYRPGLLPFRLVKATINGREFGNGLGIPTSENQKPDNFVLYPNYPNPFNPITKISYKITRRSYIKMKVYDLLGSEIKTIVSEMKDPGNYFAFFDSNGLNSGMYICRMISENNVKFIKMLFLK
jgi:hypothetical protein